VRKAEVPDYSTSMVLFIVGFILYGISRIGIPMLQLYFVGDSHHTGDFFHRACHRVSGPASRPPNQFVIAECGELLLVGVPAPVRSRPEITGGERSLRDDRQGSFMQNQEPGYPSFQLFCSLYWKLVPLCIGEVHLCSVSIEAGGCWVATNTSEMRIP
jgi:hypothetical protein